MAHICVDGLGAGGMVGQFAHATPMDGAESSMNRRQFLTMGGAAGLIAGTRPGFAGTEMFCSISGAALGGYDPATYFTKSGPRRGRRDMALMWKGAVWHFVDSRHLALFEANPWVLAPRFGGYCAAALSRGRLVPGDPLAWSVVEGRLYVMASLDAREAWLEDIDAHVAKADRYWPLILRG